MLALMHVLLEAFEPDPNGFRFDSLAKISSFAALTAGPVVVGLAAASMRATLLAATAQFLSPLALVPAMVDANSDLNFAILLWWLPVPAAVAAIVWFDRRAAIPRRTRQGS